MVWYNEGDIERAAELTAKLPVESRRRQVARLLSAFRDVVNANSDGWCYWALASKAATGLIAILESNDAEPSERAFNAAVARVKTLCTKYRLPFPTGWDEPKQDAEKLEASGEHSTCGGVVTISNCEQAVEYTFDELVERIGKALRDLSGEELARFYNAEFGSGMLYCGNDVFKQTIEVATEVSSG